MGVWYDVSILCWRARVSCVRAGFVFFSRGLSVEIRPRLGEGFVFALAMSVLPFVTIRERLYKENDTLFWLLN